MTELCELYNISRKTGSKWVDRFLRNGPAGLEEVSRQPRTYPHKTPYPSATSTQLAIARSFYSLRYHQMQ
ncbi:MAG: helix-turn-helix domain-containing protein [Chromatiaceae bacterium]|nr:helix-turn-helix domain-containing protein [Chromatiaceae bacterium]